MNHGKTNTIYLLIMLFGIILFGPIAGLPTLRAEVTVYLDPVYNIDGQETPLTIENLMDPKFPKPKNPLPVLFIPDYDFQNKENFRNNFQSSLNGLPSFRDTLLIEENSSLGIEPYYMDLAPSTGNDDTAANARKIEEAVNLILLHQGTPEAKTKKVAIIAYGTGAAGARFYLKNLWERQNKRLSFHPVSELITILNLDRDSTKAAPIDYCAQLMASVNPGSRENNEPVEKGILYVTIPANGNQDMVHNPEVIGKALYTVCYHQAPPDEYQFQSSDEKNPQSPPVIPPLQIPRRDIGIVLLFDISPQMSHLLPAVQNTTGAFLELLDDYCSRTHNKVNLGIAVFPPLGGNEQKDCSGQIIRSMTLITGKTTADAIKTIDCLNARANSGNSGNSANTGNSGNAPLLQGIDTAVQMFSGENRKMIILVSAGLHNCPTPVNLNIEDETVKSVKSRINKLNEIGVTIHAIGIGQDINMGYDLLRKLVGDRPKHLNGKFIPVSESEPGTALHEAYRSLFSEIMELEEAGPAMDTKIDTKTNIKMKPGFDKISYNTGDTITITATVAKNGHPVIGLTDVSVKVTPLNKPLPAQAGETIQLHDDGSDGNHGNHGDKEKNDGIYTNRYSQSVNEGTYQFLFHAAGDTFIIEKKESLYVSVKADPLYSNLNIQWRDIFIGQQEQYLYDVEFTPRDRYGNNIGSAHKVEMAIDYNDKEKKDSEPLFHLQGNPEGTYKGEISITRYGLNNGARLVLMIDGKPFTTIEKIPGFKKWSLAIHSGVGFPISDFKKHYGAGINFSGHIGYRLTPTFSLVGIIGYNYFSSSSSLSHDSLWWNISANLRSEIVKNPLRFYINAGAGFYLSKGGPRKSGVNVGAAAAYLLSSSYSIELGTDFHLIDTLGADSTFLVTHAGFVYRL